MKLKTRIKLVYALRAQAKLFRHPFMSFRIQGKDVNMYQFIHHGWKVIDQVVKE